MESAALRHVSDERSHGGTVRERIATCHGHMPIELDNAEEACVERLAELGVNT